jgi:hypothetical protein
MSKRQGMRITSSNVTANILCLRRLVSCRQDKLLRANGTAQWVGQFGSFPNPIWSTACNGGIGKALYRPLNKCTDNPCLQLKRDV